MAQELAMGPEALAEIPRYKWTPEQFLRAWEAGAFDGRRVELLDGEVVPVSTGEWHSKARLWLVKRLPDTGVDVRDATLPSGSSLPDPDVWVRRGGAKPKKQISEQLSSWHAKDVLLVVEVSVTSNAIDLTFKAQLYGSAGCAEYWVVTQEAVYAHRQPTPNGYRTRVEYRPGEQITVPYAPESSIDVGALIAA